MCEGAMKEKMRKPNTECKMRINYASKNRTLKILKEKYVIATTSYVAMYSYVL